MTNKLIFIINVYFNTFTATAGAEGRAALMREIELGKLLGAENEPLNVVKFLGCVTRRGRTSFS